MQKGIKLPASYTYITAFLTMSCNLNCSYCLNANNKNFDRKDFKIISGEKWVEALNRIVSRPEVPITFTGGEPFLHKDFIYIINNLKPELNIDILTNLKWGEKGLEKFIAEIKPERIKRDSPYASIRVSYHPEQMGNGEELVENVKKLQNAGFSIGIWAVQHPDSKTLESITQMQFRCREKGIDFRLKDFVGKYEGKDDIGRFFSILYGNYSKYSNSCFQETTKNCLCKTRELLIGTDARVYRCHRDLYAQEHSIGNLLDNNFKISEEFMPCGNFGQCEPCDVKVKTNHQQQPGYTSVEIKEISQALPLKEIFDV